MDEKKIFQTVRFFSLTFGFASFEFIFIIMMVNLEIIIPIFLLYAGILMQMELPLIKKTFDFKYHSEQVKNYDFLSGIIIGCSGFIWIIILTYGLLYELLASYIVILTYIIVAFQIMVYNVLKLKKTKLKQSITRSFRSWLIIEGNAVLCLVALIFIEIIFNAPHIPLFLLIYLGMEGITNILYGFKGAIFYDPNNISENNEQID